MSPADDLEKEGGGRTSVTDRRIAYVLLRIVFGVDIFFHGLSRLFGDHAAFLAYLSQQMAKAPLPKSLLPPFAATLPWAEATIGLLLLLGLFTRFALVAGSFVMIALIAGITLAQNWDVAGIQLIYCAIYFVLLTHRSRNFYSLDTLFKRS
jgi:thiosulfate dehydrogenase [quinone] large subunit